jgi:hypothetical protein
LHWCCESEKCQVSWSNPLTTPKIQTKKLSEYENNFNDIKYSSKYLTTNEKFTNGEVDNPKHSSQIKRKKETNRK